MVDGKIIIVNKKEVKEPKEELVEDVLQIMNIFVAKMNGKLWEELLYLWSIYALLKVHK